MFTKHTTKEIKPLLENKTDFARSLVSECKNCVGTVLLIDQDSEILLEYHLLFSRIGFRTIKIRHPNDIFTLFHNNEYDADIIISSTSMQMIEWVDCLAMIRNGYNKRLNLLTTPVVFYGALPSGHFDTSLPNAHFLIRPPAKLMLETVLWILKHKCNG